MNADDEGLLMIPGPIEFSPEVLKAMSSHSLSHVDPKFGKEFGEALVLLKEFLGASSKGAQPFIIAGSGSLGWDMLAANLTEPGERVLVLNAGYFGTRFADCLRVYGCKVDELDVIAPGHVHNVQDVEKCVKDAVSAGSPFRMITITHVDTSTGILSPVQEIAAAVKKVSPDTLVIVDGVCSIGGEAFRFDDWEIDGLMTASQKALGCPAGLSIQVLSQKAISRFQSIPGSVRTFYGSYARWLPIMQGYECVATGIGNIPMGYFATPSVHLIRTLRVSLGQLLAPVSEGGFGGYEAVIARHREASKYVRDKLTAAIPQLTFLPKDLIKGTANTMTACLYSTQAKDKAELAAFLGRVRKAGVVLAGGLLPNILYFRIGHMGYSVNAKFYPQHMDRTIQAIISAMK